MIKKQAPAVLVFREMVYALIKRLSHEKFGMFMEGYFKFAFDGEEPDFENDDVLALAWDFNRPKIQYSLDHYERSVDNKKLASDYSAYKRRQEKNHLEVLPFEDWKAEHMEPCGDHVDADDEYMDPILYKPERHNQKISIDREETRALAPPPPPEQRIPTEQEVRDYCISKGYHFSVPKFYERYFSQGHLCTDWQQKAEKWERTERPRQPNQIHGSAGYGPTEADMEGLRRFIESMEDGNHAEHNPDESDPIEMP